MRLRERRQALLATALLLLLNVVVNALLVYRL